MRVLVLSAFLACVAAAPSGIVAPFVYQAVGIPAAIPTISPGDIQAAAIDAQVKLNDLARYSVDKAQDITEQAVLNANDKIITDVDLANERTVEAFWSNEDKKWQALDALKTAEAQIDGAAASNAAEFAKSTVSGVLPYVALPAPVAPVVAIAAPAPIPPVVYTPYGAAAKSISTETTEVKAEENKEEKQEAIVKAAEPEKAAAPETAEKTDTATKESADTPAAFSNSIVTPISSVYRYDFTAPAGNQIFAQPLINYAAIQPFPGVLTSTIVKGSC